MEAMLFAALLSCADGSWILSGLVKAPFLSDAERSELRFEIIQEMPDDCSHAEYNPTGRK